MVSRSIIDHRNTYINQNLTMIELVNIPLQVFVMRWPIYLFSVFLYFNSFKSF